MSNLPNFIIIGAGKSGTTSLYDYLSQHPDIFMSATKETNYFALKGKEIPAVDTSTNQTEHYPWAINNLEEYEALFADVKDETAIGEVSPMYLYNADAPLNMAETIPNVKIIAILRQPVERLYSRYMHLVRENREPEIPFEQCYLSNSIWWQRNDLITEGFYGTYLNRYFELFKREQIKVFLYEELRTSQEKVLNEIFEFIGVNPDFVPKQYQLNKSGKIKNKNIDALIGQRSVLKRIAQGVSPRLVKAAKNSPYISKTVHSWRNKNLEKAPLDPVLKHQLTQSIYKEEIKLLEKLLDKNLASWLA